MTDAEILKAYRATGLEPDAVEKIKLYAMGKSIAEIKEFDGILIDHLRKLVQAEKAGRLVVLPCKVGDIVWLTSYMGITAEPPIKAKCVAVKWYSFDGTFLYTATTCGGFDRRFTSQDIGETVFLSREEAESALEAQKGGAT